MNQNLNTMEGCRYKITLKFTGQEDLGDYSIYGSSCHLGCSRCHSDFEILEKNADSCIMVIPALKAGSHLYQLFLKRLSTNQEFLVLDGRIEVKNRCGDGVSEAINSSSSEVEINFNAEEIQVNVTIQEGSKGERGEKGDTGERGEDGKFEDLTEEQKQEIISPVSEQIATLSETVSEQGEKIEEIEETVDKIKLELSDVISQDYFTDSKTTQAVVAWRLKIKHSGSLLKFDNFKLSAYATDNWARKGLITIYSSNGETLRTGETVVFYGFKTSNNDLENGILLLNPLEVNEGEVLEIKFYICSATGVLYDTTDEEYSPMNMEVNSSADDGEYCFVRNARTIYQYNGTPYISLIIEGTPAILRNLEERVEILEENADPGEGTSIDFILTNPNDSYQGTPTITPNADGSTVNNLLIGNGITVSGGGNTVIGLKANVANANDGYREGDSVAAGLMASANGFRSVAVGTLAGTSASCSVAVGAAAKVNENCFESVAIGQGSTVYNPYGISIGNASSNNGYGVTIGHNAWTSSEAVAIGNSANADTYGIAIGNSAYADYGNITLKSGNVEVKFTPDGMTLNGEPYGQGGSGGGSDTGIDMCNIYKYMGKYSNCEYTAQLEEKGMVWKDEYGTEILRYIDDMIKDGGVWQYSLDKLTDGTHLFSNESRTGADQLIKFVSNTPYLQDASSMFFGCINLEYLYMDFSHVTSTWRIFGEDTSSCTKLNAESIENIADTICWGNNMELYIGIANELQWDYGDGEYQKCQNALQRIRDKAWTVYEIYSMNY